MRFVVIAWWGAPLGALVGLPFGGTVTVLGAFAAGLLSRWRWRRWHDTIRDDPVIQRAFFRLLGFACKASGSIQPAHIQATRTLMDAWDLSLSDQESAIKAFNLGKRGIDAPSVQARLKRRCESRLMQWLMAGWVVQVSRSAYQSLSAEKVVGDLLKEFGLPRGVLRLKRNPQPTQAPPAPPVCPAKTPWQILEIPPTTRGPALKKAYRRAMGAVHPDKVAAAGGTDAQVQAAKIKAQQIQEAWAKIKHLAGR